MKIKRACEKCGGDFYADHWNVARGRGRFCSPHCVHEWLRVERSGKKIKAKKKSPTNAKNR